MAESYSLRLSYLDDIILGMTLSLREREIALVSGLLTSANKAEICKLNLGLTKNPAGLTVVDLASGASSLVAELIEEGADAHGFDQMYADPASMDDYIQRSFIAIEKLAQRKSPEERRRTLTNVRDSIGKFRASFLEYPEHYHSGWLSELPFDDHFADWTVSLCGVSDLAIDFELYEQVMGEAVRITKVGGVVVMVPFHSPRGLSRKYHREHELLVKKLIRARVGNVIIEKTAEMDDLRLRIVVK